MQEDVILRLWNDTDSVITPLFQGYNIGLSYKFTDIQDFAQTGTLSYNFRIPMTVEMVDFMGAVFDPNHFGWFDPRRKIRAELSVDTVPIAIGHIQVNDIIQQGTDGNEIEITFFGETPDLARELGDLNLSDITDLSTLNHVCDHDAVTNDALNSGNTLYFLVDKGQIYSENGEVGTRPIFNSSQPIYPAELCPAIPARWLWDNIFSDAGFVVDSPSNFPDLLDDNYIPWYNGTAYVQSTDDPSAENFTLYLATADTVTINTGGYADVTTMTEEFDNGGNVAANVFTAPLTGTYSFRAGIYWQKTAGVVATVNLNLRSSANNVLYTSAWSQNSNNNIPKQIYFETQLQLEAGDTVKLSVFQSGNNTIQLLGTADPTLQGGTGLQMYELSGVLYGQTVDMVKNAPIMRQIDFIRSIAKMYNLAFVPDRNIPKKIRIEPLNDYLQSGATVDWTGKLDLDKDRRLTPTTSLQADELLWTYKSDGDWLNKLYQDEGGRIFGELSNEDSNYFDALASDFATGSLKVEVMFSSTPCANIAGTAIPIPKFIDSQGKAIKVNPRILYWAASVADVQVFDDDTSASADTTVRILSHFDLIDYANNEPGAATLDLNFGQEIIPQEFQQTFGASNFTLFNRYWRDYIRELYDQTSRMLTGHFALSISDILNFSFADRIWIKDSYWRILEINNFGVGVGNTTEVKFIKILSTTAECAVTPSQSNANGTVSFIDGNGDPAAATQTCCELYGYTWDGVTNTCRWNAGGTGGQIPRPAASGGTQGWGYGEGGDALPPYVAAIVAKAEIQQGNFGVFAGGTDIKIDSGNSGSGVFGHSIDVSGDLRGGIGAFGKNALITHAGLHLGGGYMDGSSGTTQGRAQQGVILLTGAGELTTIGDTIELLIEDVDRIVLPNSSAWACTLEVSIIERNIATGALDEYGQQTYNFALYKSLNAAGVTASPINPTHEDTSFNTNLQLQIDVATDTTQHRLSIYTASAAGLTAGTFQFTAALYYTQVVHTA